MLLSWHMVRRMTAIKPLVCPCVCVCETINFRLKTQTTCVCVRVLFVKQSNLYQLFTKCEACVRVIVATVTSVNHCHGNLTYR